MLSLWDEQKNRLLCQVKELRKALNALKITNIFQKFDLFENQLTLDELEEFFSKATPESFRPELIKFFANRWERIRGTSLCYTNNPTNMINEVCLCLATDLSPPIKEESQIEALKPNTGPYCLLMPSLENSVDVYGVNIHSLKLYEFVLSDKERVFIPLLPCLHQASISDEGRLRHMIEIDKGYPELTPSEIERVTYHSGQTRDLYQSISEFNNRRLLGNDIGPKLSQLVIALRSGGSHTNQGSGTDLNAGTEANLGILAFNKYWTELPEKQKAAIFAETPDLKDVIGRLFRPKDEDYKDTVFCVELLADRLEPIIKQFNNKPSIQMLEKKIKDKENALQSALENSRKLVRIKTLNPPKHILHRIFKLSATEQKKFFVNTRCDNALTYALEHDLDALFEFDFGEKSNKQDTLARVKSNIDSGLIDAVKRGNKNAVDLLLSWGANIQSQDFTGYDALYWAIRENNIDIVVFLLDKGASLEASTRFKKNTALNIAVLNGKKEIVDFLIKRGSHINARNIDGKNALEIAIESHPELIEPLLMHIATLPLSEQMECLLNVPGGPYPNAFFYAAANKTGLFLPLIKQALSQPKNPIRDALLGNKDGTGHTVLHWASQIGNIDAIDCLLEHGAELEALTNKLNTPLNVAVLNGTRLAVYKLLFKRPNFNARNIDGKNALDIAIDSHPELVEPLLIQIATLPIPEQMECLLNVPDGPYPNALFYAAANKPELLLTLIKLTLSPQREELRVGLIKDTDGAGLTILHWASRIGDVDAVNCFLEHGAELEALTDRKNTPFNVAVSYGNRQVVDLLIKKSNLNARNIDGNNALDIAIEIHPQLVKPLLMHIATLPISEQAECLLKVPNGPYPNAFVYAATLNSNLLYPLPFI